MSAPWLLEMVWRDVCFLHWRADAARLERMLPQNVTLDRYDGEAWLSVVPFRMTAIRVRCLPALSGLSDVPEINLRTYVQVGGVRGIWFFSLDADGALLVRAARVTTGLPYHDARIAASENASGISYRSERSGRGRVMSRFAAHYAPPAIEHIAAASSLEAFLHERYRFFTCRRGQLVSGMVHHQPWSLGAVAANITENTLGEVIEHPLVGAPQRAYFARRLQVRADRVRSVRG